MAPTTTASYKQVYGLPVVIGDPLWFANPATRGDLVTGVKDGSYSHELDANGGYVSAQLVFPTNKLKAEEWFATGLGRDITIHNPGGVVIFNGFVNRINVSVGPLTSEERGPLMNVANRVSGVYTYLDNSVYPPVKGTREVTTIVQDTVSQALYGIIEGVISVGAATTEDAERARDTYLEENKDPETSGDISIPGGGSPIVTLEVLGYVEWLKAYVYNNTNTGTIAISDKLEAILTADPNSLISTDFINITANPYLTTESELNDRFAEAIIKGLVSLGDAADNRYILGVYRDRMVSYGAVPTTIEYAIRLADGRQSIVQSTGGAIVQPWDVLPGRWIQVSDWLIGRVQETTLRADPRNKFIESVRFSAPDQVQLIGQKVNRVPQLIAKLGLSGST